MPVVDEVAADYAEEVAFVAVAGRADLERTAARAEELFSDRLAWGLDDEVWQLYGVSGQPYTVLVTADGTIADRWFGAVGEEEIRARLDVLLSRGA